MSRQDQRIGDQASGVQAARDVIIYGGMSPEQMTTIMVNMAKQLAFYQVEAQQTVESRLFSFREEILEKFTKSGEANREAFRDPDFQYLLNDAQIAYARSGDEAVRDTLVDIIARRSLETERSRMAVTLNDAATKAPLLTKNEFAELSLTYFLTRQQRRIREASRLSASRKPSNKHPAPEPAHFNSTGEDTASRRRRLQAVIVRRSPTSVSSQCAPRHGLARS
jgi:hypothetical protein